METPIYSLDVAGIVHRNQHLLPLKVNSSDMLGCGKYGCVFSTEEDGVVAKVTVDSTEVEFVSLLLKNIIPLSEGVVRYFDIGWSTIDGKFQPQGILSSMYPDMKILYREEAFDVGKFPYFHEDEAELISTFTSWADNIMHLKRDKFLWKKALSLKENNEYIDDELATESVDYVLYTEYGNRRMSDELELAMSWQACEKLAVILSKRDSSSLIGKTLDVFLKNLILLADVHMNNIGRTVRGWVITDPGRSIVIAA